ncbi:uncharacterized protein MKK02DRAFT_42559 [Dioszegia hungarica]|uniref:Uncharacterized protein n=1 Tax=Dioszegia hungarica TaxID=4972 RepID=A0AA38HCP8_9TREE|nr:uncharacterized protein MKK02DRAFT_42559 [Dioszegia hungarica]KAI9638170.1 hypothetical protein MKK02DRAFT_42559 [Dioszegia hungarica]
MPYRINKDDDSNWFMEEYDSESRRGSWKTTIDEFKSWARSLRTRPTTSSHSHTATYTANDPWSSSKGRYSTHQSGDYTTNEETTSSHTQGETKTSARARLRKKPKPESGASRSHDEATSGSQWLFSELAETLCPKKDITGKSEATIRKETFSRRAKKTVYWTGVWATLPIWGSLALVGALP